MFLIITVCFFYGTFAFDTSYFTNHTQKEGIFATKVLDKSEIKAIAEDGDIVNLQEHKWYIGGKRIRGDSFKYELNDENTFPDFRDFIIEISFPEQHEFYITQVMVFAQQSSTIGKAYIVDGGIGYTFMRLIIEARRTKYLNFSLHIYGRNFT